MEAAKETKFGTKVARGEEDARASNTCIVQRKHMIPHSTMKNHRNMTCILVTGVCNQPETCISDLGDNQLRYLFIIIIFTQHTGESSKAGCCL